VPENIQDWLIEWFVNNADMEEMEVKKNLGSNYFNRSWIDSFKFISLITEIEEKFDIYFSNDEFQDRSFSTIEGLAVLIQRKISEK
jgi:acyl carrier protein